MEAEVKLERLTGRVTKTVNDYAFIKTDDGNQFFTHLQVTIKRRPLRRNQVVRFTPVWEGVAPGRKPRAIDVEVL
jgi:hypothetical protein